MKKQNFSIGMMLILTIITGTAIFAAADSKEKNTPTRALVVGTYDSRAVAVACTHSKFQKQLIQEKMAQLQKAQKAGDTEKVNQLQAWGDAQQQELHKQGFGTASVKQLLEYVKQDIPKVAKEAGVDIIVSKWDLTYQSKNAEFVDVTELIIRGFEPSEKTLNTIRQLIKTKPLSEKTIEEHKH